MHLILVGFPGVGKTTVGKEVAQRLKMPFVDTDAVLGDAAALWRAGRLRTEECALLEDLLSAPPSVIATGGGTPLAAFDLRRLGWIVYLRAEVATLTGRLDPQRPLLQKLSLPALAKERFPLYERVADFTVTIDPMTTKEIASMICEQWATHLVPSSGS